MKFSTKLLRWYKKNARQLPWRETKDPYKIWVSEIMLQQTTVKAVIPYYNSWIKKFPDIKTLANAREQQVLKQWQGLGYYNRARNLHKASKIILKDYGGVLPRDPDQLKQLPGFGPYTTGAVSSIAFGIKYPIIDANVRRVVMRILGVEGKADAKRDAVILEFLERELPDKHIGDFNQALMEMGALICTSRNPKCNLCPLMHDCVAYIQGIQELIPQPSSRPVTELNVVVGVLMSGNKIYIQQRKDKSLMDGLWEFPGGKIKRGESPQEALKREIREEVGINVLPGKLLIEVRHYYTKFKVNLAAYQVPVTSGNFTDLPGRWVTLKQFSELPMPSGTVKIVDFLFKNK